MAQRIAEDALVLLEGRQQKVEQRWSGLRLDVALQGGDRDLVALDQLGDDRRIGLEVSGRAPDRRPTRALVRERGEEVAAFEDGLQRVPDQRIASPHDLKKTDPSRRRSQSLGDVDEQPAPGLVHRHHRRQLPHGHPQGPHRLGHHLPMTN
jgi:hypothetical protein